MMIKLILLFGKSAAGKDTLAKEWTEKYKAHRVVPYTTRPRRSNEMTGKDYYFLTDEEFTQREDIVEYDYIQARCWHYGVSKDLFREDKINIMVAGTKGAEVFLERAADLELEITLVYVACSDKERLLRSLNREENPDVHEIVRRYMADEGDFQDFFLKHSDLEFLVYDTENPPDLGKTD